MSEKFSLPVAIIIAGLLIGGGVYLNGRITRSNPTANQRQQIESQNLSDTMRPIDASDYVLGNSNAQILVVEYSDTECPYCKNFHNTMLSIMQEYGKDGKVAWIYRSYPIVELHSKSFKEAEALECAGSLGGNSKFWEYTNKVYETTNSNDSLDPAELSNIAKKVGLSSLDFESCLSSGKFTEKVNASIKDAQNIGILGTPYSIMINTKTGERFPIEGAFPYTSVRSVVEMILNS